MKYRKLMSIILSLVILTVLLPEITAKGPDALIINIHVDDDFNETTPGWGIDHFDSIQDGVFAAPIEGIIYVYNGIYRESIVISNTVTLTSENNTKTIIDGIGIDDVVKISGVGVRINGFTIRNSSSSHWTKAGIRISSEGNLIDNNIIKDNEQGIYLDSRANNTITKNHITDSNHNGIGTSRGADYNVISENVIDNSSRYGISICRAQGNQIFKNTIRDTSSYSITIDIDSNDTLVTDNQIYGGRVGIFIRGSSNCTIKDNIIADTVGNGGIDLRDAQENIIINNYIYRNIWGISLGDSIENMICDNIIADNNQGIELANSSKNNISGNLLRRNGRAASLSLRFGSENNLITSNHIEGIFLDDATGNKIQFNNLYKIRGVLIFRNSVGNSWKNNYWNRPRLLPKIIYSINRENEQVSLHVDLDLNPALIPYYI